MRETVSILDVNVDKITMDEAVERIAGFTKTEGVKMILTPNSEIIMVAQEDEELKKILNESDLLLPDGIGVVWGASILGTKIPGRVPGFDTMMNLYKHAQDGSISFYLFGSAPGVAEEARAKLENMYPQINILGVHDGYFDAEEEKRLIEEINELKPDVLFVAMGAPKQEKWIANNRKNINVKVCMGVGGSLDVLAGRVKRAPVFYQKMGLEWFYRLAKQPSRWRRMMNLPKFGLTVVKKRILG